MIERAIANWLTKTNERHYQSAFCQVLMHQNHRVLHCSTHGPMEQGKDIITIAETGQPHAYQTKTGDIDLTAWRTIRGEIEELIQLPIDYPGVDKAAPFKAYLVTNGVVTDPVRLQINDLNEDSLRKQKGYAPLALVTRDDLLKQFIDAQGKFMPNEPSDLRVFLEFYLSNGKDPLDRAALFQVLETATFSERPSRRSNATDAITASLVMTSYLLQSFEAENNHYALAQGWLILAACLTRYAIEYSLQRSLWEDSLNIVTGEVKRNLEGLTEEAHEREDLLEGEVPILLADGKEILKARTTMVLGATACYALCSGSCSGHSRTYDLIAKHRPNLWYWGDAAFPHFFYVIRFLETYGDRKQASEILEQLFDLIVELNYRQRQDAVLPNPYFSFEDMLNEQMPGNLEPPSYLGCTGSSYSLESVAEMLARRDKKEFLKQRWPKYTRIQLQQFRPDREVDIFCWRTQDGANISRFPRRTETWTRLKAQANDFSVVPQMWNDHQNVLELYPLVCPHRMSPRLVRFLESFSNLSCQ